jgi:hypothetical protein
LAKAGYEEHGTENRGRKERRRLTLAAGRKTARFSGKKRKKEENRSPAAPE